MVLGKSGLCIYIAYTAFGGWVYYCSGEFGLLVGTHEFCTTRILAPSGNFLGLLNWK